MKISKATYNLIFVPVEILHLLFSQCYGNALCKYSVNISNYLFSSCTTRKVRIGSSLANTNERINVATT